MIVFLAVFTLAVWLSRGVLAGLLALSASVSVYALVTLVNPVHRCPSCRGRRVKTGRRPRACRKCRSTGRTRRLGAVTVNRLAWSVAGDALRDLLGRAHEELREKSGYGE